MLLRQRAWVIISQHQKLTVYGVRRTKCGAASDQSGQKFCLMKPAWLTSPLTRWPELTVPCYVTPLATVTATQHTHTHYLSSFGVFSRCVIRKAAGLSLCVLRLRWGGAGGHPTVASDWSLPSRCPKSSALLALLNNLGCQDVILLDSAFRCEEVITEEWRWERERFSVPEIPTCSRGTWELCEYGNSIHFCFPMKERQICEHILLQLLPIQSDQSETCLRC